MHLTEPFSQRFERERRELGEALNMPYVICRLTQRRKAREADAETGKSSRLSAFA